MRYDTVDGKWAMERQELLERQEADDNSLLSAYMKGFDDALRTDRTDDDGSEDD